jgi:hypothetical protein
MKRIVSILFLLLTAWALNAQSFKLVFSDNIPADARALLAQRFEQMLKAGGLDVAEDGELLMVEGKVTNRMETPGSMSQVVLHVDLIAKTAAVSETFSLKGVGEGDSDAWLRAVKQLLPKSKSALSFVEKLK